MTLIEGWLIPVEKAKQSAVDTIIRIADVAATLGQDEQREQLRDTAAHLKDDTFRVIVMGRFKNGKSTLLNALMGGTTVEVDLGGHKGPMVVDDLPATAVLTGVSYSETPHITAVGFDGSETAWPLDKYLRESTLDVDELESQRKFGTIKEFRMGFPAKLCQHGVTIYDSPGLDDTAARTAVTREATRMCDAAVVVFRSDVLMSAGELEEVSKLVGERVRLFTVINRINGRPVDDRLKAFVWNRYMRDFRGSSDGWANQDLSEFDIFFVDANQARDARYIGDTQGVEASGLASFEDRLGKFLLYERQKEHLGRFKKQAENLVDAVEATIAQRLAAAQQDRKELREHYAELTPQLEELRRRPARVPELFRRCRAAAEPALQHSFNLMINQVRLDLPAHLEAATLPSGDSIIGVFQQKKQIMEATTVISEFVTKRLEDWGDHTAAKVIEPYIIDLHVELEREIAAIGRQVEHLHLKLSGWQPGEAATTTVKPTERVLATVGAALMGDLLGVAAGGVGGWRGTAGYVAGAVGAGVVMGVLGAAGVAISATVFWPVALAAGVIGALVGPSIGLEKRVKRIALQPADEQLAALPGQLRLTIADALRQQLDTRERAVAQAVAGLVAAEERTFVEIMRVNELEQAAREKTIDSLHDAEKKMKESRRALAEAMTTAMQG